LLASAALVTAALAATQTPAGAAGTQTIQAPEMVCAAATPGHRACGAIRLVTRQVSDSTATRLKAAGMARSASTDLGSGPAGGYTPAQLAKAYGLKTGAKTTQTVGIVDAFDDPTVRSDLNTFDSNYGFPAETGRSFKVLNQNGNASPLPTPDTGWAGEITLDVQAVRAICRHCKILLIEAKSNSDSNLAAAVNTAVAKGAKIVSNSYGGPESPADPPTLRQAYNHHRVAILASTGDDGWFGWDHVNQGGSSDNQPQAPASYNTVVGVGGTSLFLNSNGTRAGEQVWNDNGSFDAYGSTIGASLGAAGSGCSNLYNAQRWQQKVSGYKSLGCGSVKRADVDVAADADYFTGFDVFQTYGAVPTGWSTFGGTSLASPLIAGMWGLAGGPHGVKYPALTLYGHFKSTRKNLYDVTIGGTGACDTASTTGCASFFGGNPNAVVGSLVDCAWGPTGPGTLRHRAQCYAQRGYDGVSGVGTPKNSSVFKAIGPHARISVSGTVRKGSKHAFSAARSTDPFPGGSIKQYVWHWGDGHKTTTTQATAKHTYTSKGKVTITLTVTDNYRRSGTTSTKVTVH
jgi:hypothetical protein